jgi:hypothetical protein
MRVGGGLAGICAFTITLSMHHNDEPSAYSAEPTHRQSVNYTLLGYLNQRRHGRSRAGCMQLL